MQLTRRNRRWLLYLIFVTCVFLLYIIATTWSGLKPAALLKPWVDQNQLVRNISLQFEDFHSHYQLFSSKQQQICDGKRVLVLVASSPRSATKRRLVRKTWAKKKSTPSDFLVQFAVGAQSDYDTEMDLYVEMTDHNDLIRYDYSDSYENLIFKTHAMLEWQRQFCSNVKYVVKTDDDTVIDMQRINYLIKNELDNLTSTQSDAIFCKTHVDAVPYRNPFSKWYIPYSIYPHSTFPEYCSGGIYIITSSAIVRLLDSTKQKPLVHIEDLFFTGIVRQHLDIGIHSSDVFCTKQNWNLNLCPRERIKRRVAQCDVHSSDLEQVYAKLKTDQCLNAANIRFNSLFSLLFSILFLKFV